MASENTKAHNIYRLARDAAIDAQSQVQDNSVSADREALLKRCLDQLHGQVRVEKKLLENLRNPANAFPSQPDSDSAIRLWQLRSIIATYARLQTERLALPDHDSPLPELLALQTTSRTVQEARQLIPESSTELSVTRDQLALEQARLHAYTLLADALRRHLKRLQSLASERAEMSAEELLEAQIDAQTAQQNNYVDEGDQLLRQLTNFIGDHLAPMLAAEELGGPAVGDVLDITDGHLAAGFTAKGKTKQLKPAQVAEDLAEQGRQHRQAASKAIRHLVKRLLREFERDPECYITLEHETAATRYLVQAKIAELDPEDAHKMRLVDFVTD